MRKELWHMVRPVTVYILAALAVGFLCNMSVVGLMAASAYLVTGAALKTPLYALSLAVTGVRACGIFRAVFRYAERYISHNAAFAVWQRLRLMLYRKVVAALPFSDSTIHSGDIFMAVIESLDDLRDAVLRLILPPLGGFLMTAALFFFILPYSAAAAAIFAAAFFLIALLLPVIFRPGKEKLLSSLEAELYEFIDGAAELAVFDYGDKRSVLAYGKIDAMAAAERGQFVFASMAETLAQITAAAAIVSILGIFIDIMPQITAVNAAVLLLAVTAAFEILIPLASMGTQFRKAAEAANRIKALLRAQPAVLPAPPEYIPAEQDILTVHNVSFNYRESVQLYGNMDLALRKGERTALIGSSGSGKSTLVYLLARLLAYNSGAIFLQDKVYNDIGEEEIRKNIRIALQDQYIFDATIRENFLLAYPDITDKQIYEALEAAGLSDFVQRTPQGLDTRTGRGGAFFSGGQCRRLSIALAVAGYAPLLVLDEPTAGLDALTAGEVIKTIMKLDADRTVFIVTHDLSSIEAFDKILVLAGGKIAESGTPAELMAKNGLLADMLRCRNVV